MLKKLFKKKISISEAARIFMLSVFDDVKLSWNSDKEILAEYFVDTKQLNDQYVQFDLALAIISLEFSALKNVLPSQSNDIKAIILDIVKGTEDVGDYAYECIQNEYLPLIKYSLEAQSNPVDDVASILWKKIIDHQEFNSLSVMVLARIIGVKLGKWKQISEHYKIV